MRKITVTILLAASLGGCVHSLPKASAPQHHYVAKPIVRPAPVAPPAVVAPAPQVAPSPKQTFKQRWLRKFFRDRATK